MKKLQNLMPVSVFVKAFCKVMKTLVEDEVVVNDVMLQLSTEMALTHKEVPRVLFLKGETVRKLRPEPAFTQAIRPKS